MLLFVSLARKSGRETKIRNKISQMKAVSFIIYLFIYLAVSFILVFVGTIEQKYLRHLLLSRSAALQREITG